MTFNKSRGLIAAASLLATGAAFGAQPSEATLTIHEQVIEFSEGPNFGWNVTPFAGGADTVTCDVYLPCDHFNLTIDLPDNLAEVFPTATVRTTVGWDDPVGDVAGATVEDYDVYVYDGNGNYVTDSATSNNPELMVELANGGITERRYDIVLFATAGSNYYGKIELVLGEPAEGADLDAFFGIDCEEGDEGCEASEEAAERVASGLKAGNESGVSDSARARMAGSGSLGFLTALIGLLGLRRRMR